MYYIPLLDDHSDLSLFSSSYDWKDVSDSNVKFRFKDLDTEFTLDLDEDEPSELEFFA